MPNYLCRTCGTQYAESATPPDVCTICQDERQYIGPNGQLWLTLDELRADRHNKFTSLDKGLTSIVTEPAFAIGQRAHLIQSPASNVLWDCISLIDGATVEHIRGLGGLSAIALSHPHYYSTIVEWSKAFGNIPIYIHEGDRQQVTRPDLVIQFWSGQTHKLADGLTLLNCGGHFAGSTVLHWRDGANGQGTLLTGDTIIGVPDKRYVSFMYSYPNLIPLPVTAIRRIVESIEPYRFESLYDAFAHIILKDAKNRVKVSADRYIKAIGGELP